MLKRTFPKRLDPIEAATSPTTQSTLDMLDIVRRKYIERRNSVEFLIKRNANTPPGQRIPIRKTLKPLPSVIPHADTLLDLLKHVDLGNKQSVIKTISINPKLFFEKTEFADHTHSNEIPGRIFSSVSPCQLILWLMDYNMLDEVIDLLKKEDKQKLLQQYWELLTDGLTYKTSGKNSNPQTSLHINLQELFDSYKRNFQSSEYKSIFETDFTTKKWCGDQNSLAALQRKLIPVWLFQTLAGAIGDIKNRTFLQNNQHPTYRECYTKNGLRILPFSESKLGIKCGVIRGEEPNFAILCHGLNKPIYFHTAVSTDYFFIKQIYEIRISKLHNLEEIINAKKSPKCSSS